jgi:UDP-perosamine 4-acetyltransferase
VSDRPFIIVGGGGHARVVVSALRELGKSVLGCTDPSPDASLGKDVEHLGGDEVLAEYSTQEVVLTVGIGSTQDSTLRADLFTEQKKNEFYFPPVIHLHAFVASESSIEAGTQVMAGAIVQPGTRLAENIIVNTNASIDHDCDIHDHVHVAPGAAISGEVTLEEGVHVGTGASIIQGIHIGAGSVVGAGAVVIEDVPPETRVVGIPAQPITNTS